MTLSDISQCWNNVFHEPPPPLPIDSNNIIHGNEVQYTFSSKLFHIRLLHLVVALAWAVSWSLARASQYKSECRENFYFPGQNKSFLDIRHSITVCKDHKFRITNLPGLIKFFIHILSVEARQDKTFPYNNKQHQPSVSILQNSI